MTEELHLPIVLQPQRGTRQMHRLGHLVHQHSDERLRIQRTGQRLTHLCGQLSIVIPTAVKESIDGPLNPGTQRSERSGGDNCHRCSQGSAAHAIQRQQSVETSQRDKISPENDGAYDQIDEAAVKHAVETHEVILPQGHGVDDW